MTNESIITLMLLGFFAVMAACMWLPEWIERRRRKAKLRMITPGALWKRCPEMNDMRLAGGYPLVMVEGTTAYAAGLYWVRYRELKDGSMVIGMPMETFLKLYMPAGDGRE